MLGNLYLMGRGCQYNLDKARECYAKAGDRGFTPADCMLRIVDDLLEDSDMGMPEWLR